ncbi:MAG: hypothetical protein ACYC0T_12990 [Ramlibacter sp.]
MTTSDTNDRLEPPPGEDGKHPPGTGRGADSALNALIKRRMPPPEPPPSSDGIDPDA